MGIYSRQSMLHSKWENTFIVIAYTTNARNIEHVSKNMRWWRSSALQSKLVIVYSRLFWYLCLARTASSRPSSHFCSCPKVCYICSEDVSASPNTTSSRTCTSNNKTLGVGHQATALWTISSTEVRLVRTKRWICNMSAMSVCLVCPNGCICGTISDFN